MGQYSFVSWVVLAEPSFLMVIDGLQQLFFAADKCKRLGSWHLQIGLRSSLVIPALLKYESNYLQICWKPGQEAL